MAAVATFGTSFAVAVEYREGKNGQKREDRAQRAQKLAEESLDQRHACDHDTQRHKGAGGNAVDIARVEGGEGDPGAEARYLLPSSGKA